MSSCRYCSKEVAKKRNCFGFYCSNACQAKHKTQKIFQVFEKDQTPKTLFDTSGQIKSSIRKYLIRLSGEKCSLCGWGEKREGQAISPLEIDHIDGDWENCNLTNLRVLCPNCHSLTSGYKGANRGRGRPHRQLKLSQSAPV